MSEKSRTQCGKPVSENSRMQLEFRAGAVVMMAWQHYLYDGSGQLTAIRYKGADYYYIRDGLMTITGLIDANGIAVVNYRYDSWGTVTGISGSMAGTLGKDNPYRFKGYYYDEETGMYYLKSRYYQPEICRFVSEDVYITTELNMNGGNMYSRKYRKFINIFDRQFFNKNGYKGRN